MLLSLRKFTYGDATSEGGTTEGYSVQRRHRTRTQKSVVNVTELKVENYKPKIRKQSETGKLTAAYW